jgi:hypothetical protein
MEKQVIYLTPYYLIDEDERVIYRKNNFEGSGMPEEFIIRDKRYTKRNS